MQPKVIVVSGPSGVGKGTLIAKLLAARPAIRLAVSTTTRRQRPAEEDGREYRFVSHVSFQTAIAEGALVEWSKYADHYYGTPRAELALSPQTLIECDVCGVRQLRSCLVDAIYLFIAPPSLGELERRLRSRGTEDRSQIAKRLERAQQELAAVYLYDEIIVNESTTDALTRLLALVD